jgi:hypothetical protein
VLVALGGVADDLGLELAALTARADGATERLDALMALLGPERRAAVALAMERLRRALTTLAGTSADVGRLAHSVAHGEGTIGGLLGDRELFDDLHEAHRLIKAQPLRVFIKPPKD